MGFALNCVCFACQQLRTQVSLTNIKIIWKENDDDVERNETKM